MNFKYNTDDTYSGIKMVLTLEKDGQTFEVDFNFHDWAHNVFDKGDFIGKTTLKEFMKDGWVCTKRTVTVA